MNRKQNGKPTSNGHFPRKRDTSPPQLFDGNHAGAWVDLLPSSWKPYIQLARLSPPVPILIIYCPHLFGLVHAAAVQKTPLPDVIRIAFTLFSGSVFFCNAIHAWNDLVDYPLDAKVPRTRNRPIPRGAISPRAAFVFTASQALMALCFFFFLPVDAAWSAIPSAVFNFYYPYSKRHTKIPQLFLGVALQWAVVIGSTAMGVERAWSDASVLSLFFASFTWTIVYDTVYGFQDYEADVRLGVGNTAVLFGKANGKLVLWVLSQVIVLLLFASGYFAEMSPVYTVIAVGGTFLSLNFMVVEVDLESPESCGWWFGYFFLVPAAFISLGLLGEYAL